MKTSENDNTFDNTDHFVGPPTSTSVWTTYQFLQIPSYSSMFLIYSASEKRCQVHRHGLRSDWFSHLVCIVHSTPNWTQNPANQNILNPQKRQFLSDLWAGRCLPHPSKASPQLCCLQVFLIRFVSMIYIRFLCLTTPHWSSSPVQHRSAPHERPRHSTS